MSGESACPTLRTDHLDLSALAADDEDDLHAIISIAEVCYFLPTPPSLSIAVSRNYVTACRREMGEGTSLTWMIRTRGDPATVGFVQADPRSCRFEVGIVLRPCFWGRGLAVEALTAVLRWSTSGRPGRTAWAVCDIENTAARRMLKKTGFKSGAVLPNFRVHPMRGAAPRDCLSHAWSAR